jgi:hypothetical protein
MKELGAHDCGVFPASTGAVGAEFRDLAGSLAAGTPTGGSRHGDWRSGAPHQRLIERAARIQEYPGLYRF